jgi:hypothetical protein
MSWQDALSVDGSLLSIMGLIFHVLVDREEDYQNNVKRHDLQILVENYKPRNTILR